MRGFCFLSFYIRSAQNPGKWSSYSTSKDLSSSEHLYFMDRIPQKKKILAEIKLWRDSGEQVEGTCSAKSSLCNAVLVSHLRTAYRYDHHFNVIKSLKEKKELTPICHPSNYGLDGHQNTHGSTKVPQVALVAFTCISYMIISTFFSSKSILLFPAWIYFIVYSK